MSDGLDTYRRTILFFIRFYINLHVMKHFLPALFTALVFVWSCNPEEVDADKPHDPDLTLELVNAFPDLSFELPVDLQVANDGSIRIFVVEKPGVIKVFDNNESSDVLDIFLDLRGEISTVSEQGLLGLAFHPNFSSNGYYYVHYNPNRSTSRISRFTAHGNTTISGSEMILMDIPQPMPNHNGGQVMFGPDGFLYLSIGDGGGAGDPGNNAQDLTNLLGTILRIDVDNPDDGLNYGIPDSNPFTGQAGIRPEIFAFGLRNPWRMSFDPVTGNLWTGDVGQNAREEIDNITSGGNYGWRLFEASECFSGNCDNTDLQAPVFEYDHGNNDRSITGGYVYRGNRLTTIAGKYIYGDFVSGRIWALETNGSANELLLTTGRSISAFGIDGENELYLCDFDGGIYKFIETEN